MNSNTLCKNASLALILTNDSDNKICISNNIIIGAFKRINSSNYHLNVITFDTNNKPHHVTTSSIAMHNAWMNKINFDSNKPQYATTSGMHIPNNHTIKNNVNDKRQNVTNSITTTQEENLAINPFMSP